MLLRDIAERFDAMVLSANETVRFIEQFQKSNEFLAKLYTDSVVGYLRHQGWFVAGSLGSTQISWLAQAINEERTDEIEKFMISHVRDAAETIACDSQNNWPQRAPILADAFNAHSRQQYTLSIPAMLAQADGVALEILGSFLFTSYRGKIADGVSTVTERDFSTVRLLGPLFLGLLLEPSGLGMPTSERDEQLRDGKPVAPLNRHGVLHGIDCDYATEPNSLRAISLLGFLGWVHNATIPGERDS